MPSPERSFCSLSAWPLPQRPPPPRNWIGPIARVSTPSKRGRPHSRFPARRARSRARRDSRSSIPSAARCRSGARAMRSGSIASPTANSWSGAVAALCNSSSPGAPGYRSGAAATWRASIASSTLRSSGYRKPTSPITGARPILRGPAYWASQLQAAGGSLAPIIDAFGASPEFVARYGGLTNTALVTVVYRQVLGHGPDAAGLAWYAGLLDSGAYSLGTIAVNVLDGAVTRPDATVVANRIHVANYYTGWVARRLRLRIADSRRRPARDNHGPYRQRQCGDRCD